MIQEVKAGLKYITDFYRTAPIGETLFLANIGLIPLHHDEPLLVGVNVVGALASAAVTTRQFTLRRRLEESVAEHGYTDRIFEHTIPRWCDRQVATVVAKNSGNLENYVALYQSNEHNT